ncbi:hypothetical protein TNCV_4481241 [Trichonephila clavipes]|nr:hypothetical protein TNCV_4481241 [Trichonephila clavipes]
MTVQLLNSLRFLFTQRRMTNCNLSRSNRCLRGGKGTLNNRRAANPLVRLVEGERWETPDQTQDVLPQNWGGIKPTRTVTCMVLKAKANDRRK